MPTFYYNANSEGYRKSILRSNKATIGLPGNVFPVKTDDGDDIYLSTAIFTEAATIVVSTLDCRPGEKFAYTVLVTNRKAPGVSSATAGYVKDAAKTVASNVAKTVAGAGVAARFAVGRIVGGVVGMLLGADNTGMGASLYHTVQQIKSAAGRQVQLFIGGEKA